MDQQGFSTMTPPALIDASSAILLFKAGLIKICCDGFHLLMTRSVFDEVTVPGLDLRGNRNAPGLQRLDRGERDTLQHYLNGAARFVIIDDGKGVKACRRYGIPHVNALLCPKLLYHAGWMAAPHARLFFAHIASLGRYAATVVKWAETCDESDLSFFIDERKGGNK